jgi:hypothetical protein
VTAQTDSSRTARLDAWLAGRPDRRLFTEDLAAVAGVSVPSIYKYNSEAARKRREHRPGPRDLPAPDGYKPREPGQRGALAPWWDPETVRPWLAARWNPGKPPKTGGSPGIRKTDRDKPGPKPRTRRRR